MTTQIDLDTNTPFDPNRMQELAGVVAEGVRCLNHATIWPYPGVDWPLTPWDLIDRLSTAAGRTVQLYGQIADALGARVSENRMDGHDTNVAAAVATAQSHLIQAAAMAGAAAAALDAAKEGLVNVRLREPVGAVDVDGQDDE
jgi:hypothetical protein